MKLDELKTGMTLQGLEYGQAVRLTAVEAVVRGEGCVIAVQVSWRREDGSQDDELLYRGNAETLKPVSGDQSLDFSADGAEMRLAAEAWRAC